MHTTQRNPPHFGARHTVLGVAIHAILALLLLSSAQGQDVPAVPATEVPDTGVTPHVVMGDFWDGVQAIAVQNRIAFCVSHNQMMAVDLSIPNSPVVLSRTLLHRAAMATDIVIADRYAYIAAGFGCPVSEVWDVSDARAPRYVADFRVRGHCCRLALSGMHLLAATDSVVLQVLDLASAPDLKPQGFVGYKTITGDSRPSKISTADDLAFVSTHAGLYVVRLANPSSPTLVTLYVAADVPVERTYQRTFLNFATDLPNHNLAIGGGMGLLVLDVANPSLPQPQFLTPDYPFASVSDCAVSPYGLVAVGVQGISLLRFDDQAPSLSSFLDHLGPVTSGISYSDACIHVAGSLILVASDWGLEILRVAYDDKLERIGELRAPGGADDVIVSGGLALVAQGYPHSTVKGVDLASMRVVLDFRSVLGDMGSPGLLAQRGTLLALADKSGSGLRLVDITDIQAPRLLSRLTDVRSLIQDMCFRGDSLYVATFNAGLQVVDVGAPETARVVGSLELPGYGYSVACSDRRIVVGCTDKIVIYDAARLDNSAQVVDAAGYNNQVSVCGDRVFVANSKLGLLELDVRQKRAVPLCPDVCGSDKGSISRFVCDGQRIFLAVSHEGLRELRVTGESTVVETARWPLPGGLDGVPRMVVDDEGRLFGASAFGGLFRVDNSDGSRPLD